MLGPLADCLLTRLSSRRDSPGATLVTRRILTPVGPVRAFDSGAAAPALVFVPDGPNVIEHYEELFRMLSPRLRVVCFDMPGFGHSFPQASYTHSLDQGARAVLGVLDALGLACAALAFSCANGFYAMRAAQMAPKRITQLVLSQTPSLEAMHAWTKHVVPWPIRVPVMGQLAGWMVRRKAAKNWYRIALPRGTTRDRFEKPALQALASGGCFCLAGVVQGLARENPSLLAGVNVPCTMLWGDSDRSHRYTDPTSLHSLVPGAEILRFEDCGHFPDIEQPARFAAVVLRKVLSDG
jgi:pimeloyl-ACP methyl ester carboxylesterase